MTITPIAIKSGIILRANMVIFDNNASAIIKNQDEYGCHRNREVPRGLLFYTGISKNTLVFLL